MTIEKGTTQEIIIKIYGWDLTGCDIYVTFKQGSNRLTKNTVDSVVYEKQASVITMTLSQAETMMFDDNSEGLIEARWIDASGSARKTKTAPFDTDTLLYDAVLVKADDDDG